MAIVKIARFGGVVPRYDATLLRDNMAAEAENVKLWHGVLEPFRRPAPVFDAPQLCVRTMHRFGCCWLTWSEACVDVAEWLPTCERIYVTGAGPHMLVAERPDEACVPTWLRVGLPVPTVAPITTALDAAHPERVTSSRSYVYTYVNRFGEEGAPSFPSDELLDMAEGAAASIQIPAPPAGWDIAHVRLYRLAEGFIDGTKPGESVQAAYLLVAELDPVAQQHIDTARTDELAEMLVSDQYTPPPDGLRHVTQMADGVLAGALGNQVWFCEPYQPQAWPIDYMLALDDQVRAMRWQGGTLYVMTDGHPYAISEHCADGKCCREVFRFPKPAPIASSRSATAAPDGAIYASDSGLIYLAGRRMSEMTGPWYSRDDWQALVPHSMIGAMVDGQYAGFTQRTGFLFDIRDGIEHDGMQDNDLMPLTLTPNALHAARDGKLYLAFGNVVHEWDAGTDFLPYRWRSKTTASPGQISFSAAKVTFSGYPLPTIAPFGVQFRFFTDARVPFERSVKQSRAFRLPPNRRCVEFAVEVSGVEVVREIKYATSMRELAGGSGSGSAAGNLGEAVQSIADAT